MSNHRSRVISARWIVPVCSPAIHGGWLRLVDGKIVEVGQGAAPANSEDLGDVAILPRLVNAHTHLEFSGLDQPLGEPGISFARWIGLVVDSRRNVNLIEKHAAIADGLKELWRTGTVLAGEIMTPPCQYPVGSSLPKLVPFAEVLGLTSDRAQERLTAAESHLQSFRSGACSPHAPYSISPENLDATVDLANQYNRSVAMHVAESPGERELLTNAVGPLAETLASLGVWQDGLFPWGPKPFQQIIDSLARAKSALLVHGNDLNQDEMDYLAGLDHLTVVYCPRTHHFFRFGQHPVSELLRRGIRVALGTDSRASNPDLDLWREVQFLLNSRSDLDPAEVIKMSTKNGADALGHPRWGALQKEGSSELGYVSSEATTVDQLYCDFAARDYQLI